MGPKQPIFPPQEKVIFYNRQEQMAMHFGQQMEEICELIDQGRWQDEAYLRRLLAEMQTLCQQLALFTGAHGCPGGKLPPRC